MHFYDSFTKNSTIIHYARPRFTSLIKTLKVRSLIVRQDRRFKHVSKENSTLILINFSYKYINNRCLNVSTNVKTKNLFTANENTSNNVFLPILFNVVNNIAQHCYTGEIQAQQVINNIVANFKHC